MNKFEQAFISERAGISVLDFLADELPLSKSKIKDAMQKGAVWLKREDEEPYRLRKAKEPIKLYDEVHIYYDEQFLGIKPPQLQCIDDQGQFSVWLKPSGLLDEVTLYGDHLSLERSLVRDLPHDRDCYFVEPAQGEISGLMVIAYTKVAASKLQHQLDNKKIFRSYQLTIKGNHSSDTLPGLAAGSETIELTSVDYNKYSDVSTIEFTVSIDIEAKIKPLLLEQGIDVHEESELVCSALSFISPLTDQRVKYRL